MFEIRRATFDDIHAIQELNLKLFEKEYKEFDPALDLNWTFSQKGIKYFKRKIRASFVAVAESDNKIVGYICGGKTKEPFIASEKIAEIDDIYVLDEYRKGGIGTKLITLFLEWCQKNGYKQIQVAAYIKNAPAIDLYKRFGFHEYITVLKKTAD
jgi:ribosomal protein S18 acetylase RimI-like enzyme